MDVPKYLEVLWNHRRLLVVGFVVAVLAGLLAGFTLQNGRIVSRAVHSYAASTTVLVGSPHQPLYQAEIPGQTLTQGQSAPVQKDLSQAAVVYAYVVAGAQVRASVEGEVGALADDEQITALRRTTQPGGDEKFPGRLALPILDVVGVSSDPGRAERISRAATTAFVTEVAHEQDASAMPTEQRIELTTLAEGDAVEADSSNAAIPVVVTALGVILVFVALAFILENARLRRGEVGPAHHGRRSRGRARRRGAAERPEKLGGMAADPAGGTASSVGGPSGLDGGSVDGGGLDGAAVAGDVERVPAGAGER
ncbi:hypothetical protein ET495_12875 [Xylanimonas allomyrinae]|uniref:Polysaccharide chain length determinant N-terminal domain-containing protein n=1 Tax=Xylanimonas allomyrinae TaxID=2509459 RepID=A0A4P6EMS9_9MICO|nr:hypothetical protein [Xylanimonas allomyrinae]QAY63972.1 hypothetical protein ET495_12875 [Xylanimonas allomyrinae]